MKQRSGMRLGMMQPYFFPYLGYFGLIHATDCWVVFDTPQYMRRAWVNRNRVLTTGSRAWKYVRVPVAKMDVSARICDVRIARNHVWREDLLNGLDLYRLARAPYFSDVTEFLRETLTVETHDVSALLIHCLRATCARLGLPFAPIVCSTSLSLPQSAGPGEWALLASQSLGAAEYINPVDGLHMFDADRFQAAEIKLSGLCHRLPAYDQKRPAFVPGLSIIDVMMWNDIEAVRQMICEYDVVPADRDTIAA